MLLALWENCVPKMSQWVKPNQILAGPNSSLCTFILPLHLTHMLLTLQPATLTNQQAILIKMIVTNLNWSEFTKLAHKRGWLLILDISPLTKRQTTEVFCIHFFIPAIKCGISVITVWITCYATLGSHHSPLNHLHVWICMQLWETWYYYKFYHINLLLAYINVKDCINILSPWQISSENSI